MKLEFSAFFLFFSPVLFSPSLFLSFCHSLHEFSGKSCMECYNTFTFITSSSGFTPRYAPTLTTLTFSCQACSGQFPANSGGSTSHAPLHTECLGERLTSQLGAAPPGYRTETLWDFFNVLGFCWLKEVVLEMLEGANPPKDDFLLHSEERRGLAGDFPV